MMARLEAKVRILLQSSTSVIWFGSCTVAKESKMKGSDAAKRTHKCEHYRRKFFDSNPFMVPVFLSTSNESFRKLEV